LIYSVLDAKKVLPRGMPIAWQGHYYGRDGEELNALNIGEIEQIRKQQPTEDWSAKICETANLEDLSPEAILKARSAYKTRFSHLIAEIDSWDDMTFLNKAKVCIKGKITRTAILLLGKSESEHFISPSVAKISWILKDSHNLEKDYEHFSCPFILSVDKVYQKIRNLKYRYIQENTLFPDEVLQYEPYLIRESLHNCIAHQDYALGGKIGYPSKVGFFAITRFEEVT
jgi:ATP-dependent DNA helicase RecG